MEKQNFQNHSTLKTPTKLFVVYWLTQLLLLIMATVNLIQAFNHAEQLLGAWLFMILAVLMLLSYFLFRGFSLKAQDRAIRAEENFRYFTLTGKPLPKELTIGQIIALRFASDEEFAVLTEKAVNEKLSNKAIKMEIVHWRADYHRA
ncbi:MAG TPA: DUF6526 family protein [Bacteroidia bacterium]|nr:DUF6526 family protein [Bacteroidia bacterium]HRH07813.1 DUF6526 family protein [Bacteroidia bacterium]